MVRVCSKRVCLALAVDRVPAFSIIFLGLSTCNHLPLAYKIIQMCSVHFCITMHTAGVMAGAVTTFFGFIGFDEVCCMAGEARLKIPTVRKTSWKCFCYKCIVWQAVQPQKTVPQALIGTLSIATLLPVIASLALVGCGLRQRPDFRCSYLTSAQPDYSRIAIGTMGFGTPTKVVCTTTPLRILAV